MSVKTQARVLNIIKRQKGKAFSSKDFLSVGSRDAVDKALSRLAHDGKIKRLKRGIYCIPRVNRTLGIEINPSPDDVVRVLANNTRSRILPSGAVAANKLGLTTQVPAKKVFLTDGRSRQLRVGNTIVVLKHVSSRDFVKSSALSATVFQALRYLGQGFIDDKVISQLRTSLPDAAKKILLKDATNYASRWIVDVVNKVVGQKVAA